MGSGVGVRVRVGAGVRVGVRIRVGVRVRVGVRTAADDTGRQGKEADAHQGRDGAHQPACIG